MRKLLVLFAVCIPLLAYASGTWTNPASSDPYTVVSKGVFTTGTESAPSTSTSGLNLGMGVTGFGVTYVSTTWTSYDGGSDGDGGVVLLDGGQSSFTACTLLAYVYSPYGSNGSAGWVRVSDGSLDLTVPAGTVAQFTGFTVTNPRGRIAYVPSGCGIAGNVWLSGAVKSPR